MLSKSQLDTYETLFGTKYTNKSNKKMVNSFEDKMEYTVHYRNLAFYCSLGVKATLIRGYKFHQSKFIAPYVNLCTSKRKEADSDFDKNIWKQGGVNCKPFQNVIFFFAHSQHLGIKSVAFLQVRYVFGVLPQFIPS